MKREFCLKLVRKNNNLFLFLILTVLFVGCKDEPQIERSKLVRIFVDITVAQNKYANFPDSLQTAKKEIFEKYNVTPELYESTIRNTEIKAEYWDNFFIEAKAYLDSLKMASKKN